MGPPGELASAPASARGAAILRLDPEQVSVDAERFPLGPQSLEPSVQSPRVEAGGDAAGVTERLAGVERWDERLAGLVMVWQDQGGRY